MKHSKYLRTKPYRLHKRHIPQVFSKGFKICLKMKNLLHSGGRVSKITPPEIWAFHCVSEGAAAQYPTQLKKNA
jgi:hypothetical protein